MERIARIFRSFEDAEKADLEAMAALTPQERVDLLLELVARYRESLGEAAERFERVHRVIELSEG
jgi:hypothetical protein